MAKGKRYIKKKKRGSNFILFYLLVVIVAFANYSFSRYTATTESNATIQIAKFNVYINDKKLGKEEKFNLLLSGNNKLVPDSEGYFEISINPAETHVSLEYEILFDISKLNNENRKIKLTKYSLDNGNTFITMPSNNKITGEILLNGGVALKKSDTVTLRVYWEWKQDITNPTFNNTAITVTSIVKQKVSSVEET